MRVEAEGSSAQRFVVQLLGVDAPETSPTQQCGGKEATSALLFLSFTDAQDADGDGLFDRPGGRSARVEVYTDPARSVFDARDRLNAYVSVIEETRTTDNPPYDLGQALLETGLAAFYAGNGELENDSAYARAESRAIDGPKGSWAGCNGDFHAPSSP